MAGEGYHFTYINPDYPTVAPIIREMCPSCDTHRIPASGPAPVLLRYTDLLAATPYWEKYTQWIEDSPKARKELGWVSGCWA